MGYRRTYGIKQIILIFIFLRSLYSVISETSKPSHIIDEQPGRVHFNDFHSIMILVQENFILKQKNYKKLLIISKFQYSLQKRNLRNMAKQEN